VSNRDAAMPRCHDAGDGQAGPIRRSIAASRALSLVALLAALTLATFDASARQSPTVTTAAVSPPAELAAPVAETLGPQVVTVTAGTTKLEFWWVKALSLREGASKTPSWADVPEGALVGALRLGADWHDIRGFAVRAGVYTLRFALQPQNGDHLGISPNREFLLPAPAAADTDLAPLGYEGAVDMAKKASRRAHPASMSIDPPSSPAQSLTTTTNDLGHQIVVMSVPTTAGPALTFGVVVDGTIEH
jgi:hypothetical protein